MSVVRRYRVSNRRPCRRKRYRVASVALRLLLAAVLILLAVSVVPSATRAANDTDQMDADRLFTLKILPLFKEKCLACHGGTANEIKGDFDVRTRASLVKGGESGEPAVVPGKPEESPLYLAVKWDGLEMPPKENDRLRAEQIEMVRRWIAAGAPWPDETAQRKLRDAEWSTPATADGVLVKTSGGLSDEWTYRRYRPADLWAFQPLTKPAVPDTAANPIDFFVFQKLAEAGIDRAAPADPLTLIRRASFDLTGLPPTPDDVEEFLAAWSQDAEQAWNDLIDRLLASPHYGERWAQHWLDVARYADTGGMANDYERSNMWRYRDYVIRAFNDDKPYNRFIVEQLAGDELADQSARRRLGGDEAALAAVRNNGDYSEEETEWIVATGFLRLGPWDNAMVMAPEARQIYLDDLVNAVGQTFLATTMRCVKCHDHKFDPIPTRDYYRIYAALAGTQMAERPLRFVSEENRAGFDEGRRFVQRMRDFATGEKQRLEDKRETAAKAWFQEHGLAYVPEAQRHNLPDEVKPPRDVGLDHVDEGQLKVREQDEWIWTRCLERYEPMVQSVYDGPDVSLAWNGARKLRMPKAINVHWQPDSHILMGGSLEAPGDPVQPGVLSACGLPAGAANDAFVLPAELSGRRLALARWIADDRHPLTTRAIVNRIWQYHFGQPLAGTPNNFGAKGDKPTHPDLLDWLAADFVQHGWTMKRLHKLMMMSRVYRQSGRHSQIDKLRNDDPDNSLLAYFPTRRLTAEELRDAMLRVSGELNPSLGGLPVMPEINMEVALQPRMIQFSLAPAYQPSPTPAQRNRRSIYAYRVRGQPDPFLEVFNQPNPNDSCDIRDTAAVAPQAFTLLNSDLMTDRSIAFALRLQREADALDQQIERAFQLALGRSPSSSEQTRMNAYVRDMRQYHRDHQPPAASYPARITRSLVEEFSGKVFQYDEILPVFEQYGADRKPADVSADTRALADMCLLLLASHEFVYVY